MQLPENHVAAEGRSLRAAIEAAAELLGVPPNAVDHKLDIAHFRSQGGGMTGSDTVRIFAWARSVEQFKAAVDAEAWMKGLLTAMERTGKVQADQQGDRVTVHVDVGEEARHLVGRGGATLKAIEYLLLRAVGQDGAVQFRIDVARGPEDERRRDERPREGGDRGDRGGRDRGSDRGGDRGGRDRDRGGDRGGRDRDRGGDRGGRDRDRGDRRSDPEDLKRLARKLAAKVLETGEPEVIRRELNSFERRTVHVEVAALDGVKSRSVGEGSERRIEIFRADGGYEDEDTDAGES